MRRLQDDFHRRGLPWAMLSGLFLPMPAWALVSGTVATIYNGGLPDHLQRFCVEGSSCSVSGVKEVWYGVNGSWRYKLASGTVICNNDTFGDPAPWIPKACYQRDPTEPALLPPRLAQIPLLLDFPELLTTENKRYTVDVVIGMQRVTVSSSPSETLPTALTLPTDTSVTQDYFQFNLVDSRLPVRQYSVFIAATLERCLNFRKMPDSSVQLSTGRIMEIYSMVAEPASRAIPQRSGSQTICTSDKGQLAFYLKPPSIDAFQVKVVSFGPAGQQNSVMDFFIPTSLNWVFP